METLRTPYLLTEEMQVDFYKTVICNPQCNHRYWGIHANSLIGCGGITYIQWENRLGEISLIINLSKRSHGYGRESVALLLDKAFNELNLMTVVGECYDCNPAIGFWTKIGEELFSYQTMLPRRKFYNGKYYNSLYFSIDREGYENSPLH